MPLSLAVLDSFWISLSPEFLYNYNFRMGMSSINRYFVLPFANCKQEQNVFIHIKER